MLEKGEFEDGAESTFDAIVAAIGPETALRLAALYGGRTVYIPCHPTPDHWMVTAIGMEAASALCKLFQTGKSGARVLVPMGFAMRRADVAEEITRLSDEGMSAPQIATKLGIHERSVYRHRSRILKLRVRLYGRQVAEMAEAGKLPSDIARAVGLSRRIVKAILHAVKNDERRPASRRNLIRAAGDDA